MFFNPICNCICCCIVIVLQNKIACHLTACVGFHCLSGSSSRAALHRCPARSGRSLRRQQRRGARRRRRKLGCWRALAGAVGSAPPLSPLGRSAGRASPPPRTAGRSGGAEGSGLGGMVAAAAVVSWLGSRPVDHWGQRGWCGAKVTGAPGVLLRTSVKLEGSWKERVVSNLLVGA